MPTIKECIRIIKSTPIEQAIMFYGPHGTGKSEVIKQNAIADNMVYKPFFLGQQCDASDLLGLLSKDEHSNRSVHLFPEWFPQDGKPVLLHFDELNRAKPELLSAIMDVVLNRTFNGKSLPDGSRIIATINPPDDSGTYDVEEMDAALLSRFNTYAWAPVYDDWRSYAVSIKVNEMVLAYLDKNPDHLDSIGKRTSTNGKTTEKEWKSPDRRAWMKVSDFFNFNPNIEREDTAFAMTTISGIIGHIATSKFFDFIKDMKKGVDVKDILLADTEKKLNVQLEKVAKLNVQEQGMLNTNLAQWFSDNIDKMVDAKNIANDTGKMVMGNFRKYFDVINAEIAAEFVSRMAETITGEERWGKVLMKYLPTIVRRYTEFNQAKTA